MSEKLTTVKEMLGKCQEKLSGQGKLFIANFTFGSMPVKALS